MGKLEGKVVVITGGNSGIGLASARRFVAEGAEVFITGRRQIELDKAVELIGSGVTAVQGDVSHLDDLDRLFAAVRAKSGRINVLFANAGLGELAPLGAIEEASFDLMFDVNVKGTLFTVQKALPLMHAGGSIILTGSTTGSMGTPAFSVYSATKAAIRNFARSWALDLKGTGIRVNVLSPGATDTPGLKGLARAGEEEALLDNFSTQIPLGRVGRPEEAAAVALFLASDESSFMMLFELPTGTSMDRMDQYLRQIETVVFSQDEVVSAFAGTGMMGGTNSGIIFVVLLHPNQRKANQAEIKSRLRELVAEAVPNAHFAIENMSPMGHAGRNGSGRAACRDAQPDR